MKLGKLKELLRQELDDTAKPYLWSDIELEAYINEAEREACRRARLLIDSSTAAVCEISVAISTAQYDLDSRIIAIRRAKLSGRIQPLGKAVVDDLDEARPGWDDDTGTVEAYIVDLDSNKLTLYRIPTATATLTLTVVREPLNEMNDDEDSPEIPVRYHYNMLHWAKHLAYLKKDEETLDDKRAMYHDAKFTEEFGPKRTALDEAYEAQHWYAPENGSF